MARERSFSECVALVDDEAHIRDTVSFVLRRAGYRVETYNNGLEAWEVFEQELPGIVILDILMPRMDGLELCRRLRTRSERLPILFLTSRDDELDRVLGLELGADDYLCKPFSMRELEARVKVLFRRLALSRTAAAAEEIVRVGDLSIDSQRYEASWRGQALALTITEFLLLRSLAHHPGHVKTRQQLMKEAYPHDTFVSERTIDSHVKRLRRKLSDSDPDFQPIDTVYGLGYRYQQ